MEVCKEGTSITNTLTQWQKQINLADNLCLVGIKEFLHNSKIQFFFTVIVIRDEGAINTSFAGYVPD